jgi:hypothetical protein
MQEKYTPFVGKMTEAATKVTHGASHGTHLINKCHTEAMEMDDTWLITPFFG